MSATSDTAVTVDDVILAYIKTRDLIAEKTRKLEEEIAPLKQYQEARERFLATELEKGKLTSFKSTHGTAFFERVESITVADWDTVLAYVKEHEAWHLLTRGVAKSAIQDEMGEKRDSPPPPGVSYKAFRQVKIRKK